jgi:hypothetical protein
MFPLHRRNLPTSGEELAQVLETELRRFMRKTGPIVDVHSRAFPYIDAIAIDLDGAEIERAPARPPSAGNSTKPAVEVGLINLSARNLRFRGMPLDLRLEARHVSLHQTFDAKGDIMLLPKRIERGEMSVSAAQTELEEAIARLAADQAQGHGITIERVRLMLRQRGPDSVGGDVRIEARKFVRVKIDIHGQLDIDEDFAATISELRCRGAGMIASRVCGMLEPHLARFNRRSFSLKSLWPGETHVRDLRIAITDRLEVHVAFGSANAER